MALRDRSFGRRLDPEGSDFMNGISAYIEEA
jgi:hypothetical protein